MCSAAESTQETLPQDEPFTIRDIQFNNPQIRVTFAPPIEVFGEVRRIFRILLSGAGPDPAFFGVGQKLEQAQICASFSHDDKDCAGFAFTFVQDRAKAARSLCRADDSRHSHVGGKAGAQAASFSIELDKRP